MVSALAPVVEFLSPFWAWVRPQRWGVFVTVATLVTNFVAFESVPRVRAESDGAYNWLFARSIAYDHDIDFANDYKYCTDGGGGHNKDRGGGHLDNPFYVGPSLFWVPAIEVARLVYRLPANAPEKQRLGCEGKITKFALGMGPIVAALLIWLSYRAARRLAGDYVAGLAAGLFAFGTTLTTYACYYASYSHVYDAACAAAFLLLSLRAYEQPKQLARWALAGVVLAACVLHRLTNAPLGLIAAAYASAALFREPKRLVLAVLAVVVASVSLGVVPQLLIYKYLYGRYFFVPQGPYFFQPAHAHPWLLLFAPKGLFFLAPVAWLSIFGIVLTSRDRTTRLITLPVVALIAIEVFIAACPLDWDASGSLGARRLIALFPMLIFLAAPALGAMVSWFERRADRVRALVLIALATPMAFVAFGLGVQITSNARPYDYYASQAAVYGGAASATWGVIDRVIGPLAMLPAQIAFTIRYDVKNTDYWDATQLNWFLRDQWSMRIKNAKLDLSDRRLRAALGGFTRPEKNKGAALVRDRGSLVFCTGWYRATQLVIRAKSENPVRIRVSRRTFWGKRAVYGEIAPTNDVQPYTLDIPPGSYDSGLQEILFDVVGRNPGGPPPRIFSVELVDKAEYVPVQ